MICLFVCLLFLFSSKGNENNFETRAKCERVCESMSQQMETTKSSNLMNVCDDKNKTNGFKLFLYYLYFLYIKDVLMSAQEMEMRKSDKIFFVNYFFSFLLDFCY